MVHAIQFKNFTAAQMWTLGRLLPIMVGEFVPISDEKWQNFGLLLHITDCLMSPQISRDDVANLKYIIEEHHSAFAALYPDKSFIPKLHFLIHTPRLSLA